MKRISIFLLSALGLLPSYSQECIGGAIRTHEAYLYGRFEVAMKSAEGDGVVSSFFLYNIDLDCNWPEEVNEIDIEMTGNNETVQFTTHYPPGNPGGNPWSVTNDQTYGFNPHDSIHEYAFEWEPGVVRWFIDDQLVYVQDQAFVDGLIYPMRILMNLWAADAPTWTGVWDPSIMPLQSEYEYVKFYEHTPGTGNFGTNNNFTFQWEDQFDNYDPNRWEITQFGGFGGNFCSFEASSVEFTGGKLLLKLEEPVTTNEMVPVTFSVDLSNESLLPGDNIFLNGGFNNWCGNCELMSEADDIWTVTIELPPGKHQYLFTKNFWQENGGAPQGSSCDFEPCDEWLNYGIEIPYGSAPIVLETHCWGECEACSTINLPEFLIEENRQLIRITNLLGQEVAFSENTPLLFHYDDGVVEQRLIRR